MKKKPAAININLVPKDPFFDTAMGRTLQWAISVGRYIVIFTQIIVILSFAARFTLDYQVTNLNKALTQNYNTIQTYGELEKNFRLAQAQIEEYSKIEQEANLTDVFVNLTRVTPQDVVVSTLRISPSQVVVSGTTLSQSSFNLLITNLQLLPAFQNVSVDKVEARENNAPGFNFQIKADTKTVTVVEKVQEVEEENILDRTQGL